MRITITLSDFTARKLAVWGKLNGRSRVVFASQIIANRVEDSLNLIAKMLENEANFQGISIQELEAQLIQEDPET